MDLLLATVAAAHVLLAPGAKVEESFNLHATHDILFYGVRPSSLRNYDHFLFPGAVPRSFLGSIVLAWLSSPAIHFARFVGFISAKADLLICVRLVIAFLNVVGLAILRRSVARRFGFRTSALFMIITCSQFHLPFWIGRTLPNMFALLPVNAAFSFILSRKPGVSRSAEMVKAIALLTFAAAIFRAEIFLLLGLLVFQSWFSRWLSFQTIMKIIFISSLISLLLTVMVDSYFWSMWPLWPELYSLYFNVYQGKSADWGVSPFHSYFSVHLPKLLMAGAPLSVLGFFVDRNIPELLLLPLLFIALISFLGHKEWRFIIYAVPILNIAAARGAHWLLRKRTQSIYGNLLALAVPFCIGINIIGTCILTYASMLNYPGGVALAQFNKLYADVPNVHIHICNLAAQTGATLFLHEHAPPYVPFLEPSTGTHSSWVYNKTEHLMPADLDAARHISHVITEANDMQDDHEQNAHISSITKFPQEHWRKVACVSGFEDLRIRHPFTQRAQDWPDEETTVVSRVLDLMPRLDFRFSDKLCILERRSK